MLAPNLALRRVCRRRSCNSRPVGGYRYCFKTDITERISRRLCVDGICCCLTVLSCVLDGQETLQYMRWQTFANHGTRVSCISDEATIAAVDCSGYLVGRRSWKVSGESSALGQVLGVVKVDVADEDPGIADVLNCILSTVQAMDLVSNIPYSPPLYHHMVEEHLLTCQARLRQESVCCTWVVWASRVAACHMAEGPTRMPLSRVSGVRPIQLRRHHQLVGR